MRGRRTSKTRPCSGCVGIEERRRELAPGHDDGADAADERGRRDEHDARARPPDAGASGEAIAHELRAQPDGSTERLIAAAPRTPRDARPVLGGHERRERLGRLPSPRPGFDANSRAEHVHAARRGLAPTALHGPPRDVFRRAPRGAPRGSPCATSSTSSGRSVASCSSLTGTKPGKRSSPAPLGAAARSRARRAGRRARCARSRRGTSPACRTARAPAPAARACSFASRRACAARARHRVAAPTRRPERHEARRASTSTLARVEQHHLGAADRELLRCGAWSTSRPTTTSRPRAGERPRGSASAGCRGRPRRRRGARASRCARPRRASPGPGTPRERPRPRTAAGSATRTGSCRGRPRAAAAAATSHGPLPRRPRRLRTRPRAPPSGPPSTAAESPTAAPASGPRGRSRWLARAWLAVVQAHLKTNVNFTNHAGSSARSPPASTVASQTVRDSSAPSKGSGRDPVRAWLLSLLHARTGRSLPPAARSPCARREEIVVEDQRLRPAEVFEDTAIEKEVIEEQKIEALPARDVSDIVRNLPGIRTQQRVQGEDAIVSIEGMPPEYTKILVNGARYVGAVDGVTDLADIPAFNLQRIEVLRGNQGVRYGTDAAGGVINIVTRPAPEQGDGLPDLDGGVGEDGQVSASAPTGFKPRRLRRHGLAAATTRSTASRPRPRTSASPRTHAGNEDSERLERNFYTTFDYALTERARPLRAGRLAARGLGLRQRGPRRRGARPRDRRWRARASRATASTVESPARLRDLDQHGRLPAGRPGDATRSYGDVNYFTAHHRLRGGPRVLSRSRTSTRSTSSAEHLLEPARRPRAPRRARLAALLARARERPAPAGHRPERHPRRRRRRVVLPDRRLLRERDRAFYRVGVARPRAPAPAAQPVLRAPCSPRWRCCFRPPRDRASCASRWGRTSARLRCATSTSRESCSRAALLPGREPRPQPEESSESWRAGFEWSPHRMASFSVVGFWNDFDDSIRSVRDRDIADREHRRDGHHRDDRCPRACPRLPRALLATRWSTSA